MDDKVKIINQKTIYHGWSKLEKYELRYTRENGEVEHQIREIYDSGDGATVLLINLDTEKILLVRQYRLAAHLNGHPDGFLLECCAGMLDANDPDSAIKKEIEEETGYEVTNVNKLFEAYATPGAHKEKIHFYYAFYDNMKKSSKGGGLIKEQEEIEIVEFSFNEIMPLIHEGKIMDAKTIVLLTYGILHLIPKLLTNSDIKVINSQIVN